MSDKVNEIIINGIKQRTFDKIKNTINKSWSSWESTEDRYYDIKWLVEEATEEIKKYEISN